MTSIAIPSDLLREVISTSILNALPQDKRDELIRLAIAGLLKEEEGRGYYGDKSSPIQRAFQQAASDVARKEAEKLLTADEDFQAKLRLMLQEAAERLFTANREAVLTGMVAVIERGLRLDR